MWLCHLCVTLENFISHVRRTHTYVDVALSGLTSVRNVGAAFAIVYSRIYVHNFSLLLYPVLYFVF